MRSMMRETHQCFLGILYNEAEDGLSNYTNALVCRLSSTCLNGWEKKRRQINLGAMCMNRYSTHQLQDGLTANQDSGVHLPICHPSKEGRCWHNLVCVCVFFHCLKNAFSREPTLISTRAWTLSSCNRRKYGEQKLINNQIPKIF